MICFEQKKNINEDKIWISVYSLAFGASGKSMRAEAVRKAMVDTHAKNNKESWMIGIELP